MAGLVIGGLPDVDDLRLLISVDVTSALRFVPAAGFTLALSENFGIFLKDKGALDEAVEVEVELAEVVTALLADLSSLCHC